MNYGGDYNILTPASFSGAVLNSAGIPVAQQDTSGGVYGSINLYGSNAGLKINGVTYTLIQSMSQLDALDNINAVTNMYYDTATHAYDIPATYMVITTYSWGWNMNVKYYNPADGQYDLTSITPITGNYALARNLDASGTTYITSLISSFSGTFAGLGHTISNLTINAPIQNPSTTPTTTITDVYGPFSADAALIGTTTGSTNVVRDLGLINTNVTADSGATLVGSFSGGTVSGVYATGNVNVLGNGAGLIASVTGTTVTNAYANVAVTASQTGQVGGLISYASNSTITSSHASGAVTLMGGAYTGVEDPDGNAGGAIIDYAGGLVAGMSGTVSNCYATGVVSDTHGRYVGGLLGNFAGSATNSFATGPVTALGYVGGLIGQSTGSSGSPAIVTNDYATGAVTAVGSGFASSGYVGYEGGLIGYATYTNVGNPALPRVT